MSLFRERLRQFNENLWANRWFVSLATPIVGTIVAGIVLFLLFGRGGGTQPGPEQFPPADHVPESTTPIATDQGADTGVVSELWMRSLASGPSSERWEGDIDVNAGEQIHLYAAVHNHTAEDTATPCLTATFPARIEANGASEAEFTATLSGASLQRVQDKTVLRSEEGVQLEYIQNTVRITTDLDGDGVKEEEIFVENGERIFDDCLPLGHVAGFDAIVAQVAFTLEASPLGVP